jgi:hypothetical protein
MPHHSLSAEVVILQLSMLRENLWIEPPAYLMKYLSDVVKRDHRSYLMMCTELIKLNASVCYTDDRLQVLVQGMSKRLDEVPKLAAYAEDFRRKCLASHRDAARKRLVSFYFKRCEGLCDDVIEKVLEHV